ncbi:MAG: (d)CMP kinase [Tissierellia bacterium]|jgi:cytidylate kinase|nr:(d)CMP kinase [Tissierellia bacterium]
MQIAIDGPSGAGKSTIAKELSKRLGYEYLDTGAMYRALALEFDKKNFIDYEDEDKIRDILSNIQIDVIDGRILINNKDISNSLRDEKIGMLASKISSFSLIREFLVDKQREIATDKDIIMDGRDVGTVILKDADCKIFLTAVLEKRAERRVEQLKEKGENPKYETVLKSIEKRDFDDCNRIHSPLKKADDAVIVDCTNLTIDETIEKILDILSNCGG